MKNTSLITDPFSIKPDSDCNYHVGDMMFTSCQFEEIYGTNSNQSDCVCTSRRGGILGLYDKDYWRWTKKNIQGEIGT